MPDAQVEFLFQSARAAIEAGVPVPAQFLIPVGARRWRVLAQDLVAVGENDLGIPPRAFAYGAVGMLVGSLGGTVAYAMEAPGAPPRDLAMVQLTAMVGPAVPAPTPKMAVVVTVFGRGRLQVHVLAFSRRDDGTVVWGAPTVRATDDPTALGAAIPLWRAVNREPVRLPPPEGLIEDMTDSGFTVFVED